MEPGNPEESDPLDLLEKELYGDVLSAMRSERSDPSQYNRRSFVRAVFAYIEGMTHILKQSALNLHSSGLAKYSAAEVAMLREESYELDDSGEATVQRRFFAMKRNVRFALAALGRAQDADFKIDYGGSGWAAFVKARTNSAISALAGLGARVVF